MRVRMSTKIAANNSCPVWEKRRRFWFMSVFAVCPHWWRRNYSDLRVKTKSSWTNRYQLFWCLHSFKSWEKEKRKTFKRFLKKVYKKNEGTWWSASLRKKLRRVAFFLRREMTITFVEDAESSERVSRCVGAKNLFDAGLPAAERQHFNFAQRIFSFESPAARSEA